MRPAMRPVLRPVRTVAVLTAGAAAALAMTAGPAQAEVQSAQDARGDVTTFGDPDFPGRDGVKRSVDVVTLAGDHGDGMLTFRVGVVDLTFNPNEEVRASARFVTTGGRDWTATISRGPLSPGSKQVTLAEAGADPVACDGLVGRALPESDRFVLRVPRSCVRNPSAVRFGAAVSMTDLNSGNPDCCPNGYSDDARRPRAGFEPVRLGTRTLANN